MLVRCSIRLSLLWKIMMDNLDNVLGSTIYLEHEYLAY